MHVLRFNGKQCKQCMFFKQDQSNWLKVRAGKLSEVPIQECLDKILSQVATFWVFVLKNCAELYATLEITLKIETFSLSRQKTKIGTSIFNHGIMKKVG